MIRRDIRLQDGSLHWQLISQVEHARLSAELAAYAIQRFGTAAGASSDPSHLRPLRNELLAALTHHDDGWADWDAEGQLDEKQRPPSFRELPLEVSIPIWTASIESAARCGDLAGAIVAGHFLSLLEGSEKPSREAPRVVHWQTEMTSRREKWLADWQAADPQLHSPELASEALTWLQLFDVMSLWLCSVCPCAEEEATAGTESYHFDEGDRLATTLSCHIFGAGEAPRMIVDPWLFEVESIEVSAQGGLLPVDKYQTVDQLRTAWQPHQISWRLTPCGAEA